MSGVYIPGMAMPSCCDECRFAVERYEGSGVEYCAVMNNRGESTKVTTNSCPLVPVPDHGRLIEAGAAKEFLKSLSAALPNYVPKWTWGELYESNCVAIDKLPTIIPAEESDTT